MLLFRRLNFQPIRILLPHHWPLNSYMEVFAQWDAPLFVALARATERRLREFSALDVASTAGLFTSPAQWDAAPSATFAFRKLGDCDFKKD